MKYFDIYFNRYDESGNVDNRFDHSIYQGANEKEAKEAYEDSIIYERDELEHAPDGFSTVIVFNQYSIDLKEGEEITDYIIEERGITLERSCELVKDGEKVKTFRHRVALKK